MPVTVRRPRWFHLWRRRPAELEAQHERIKEELAAGNRDVERLARRSQALRRTVEEFEGTTINSEEEARLRREIDVELTRLELDTETAKRRSKETEALIAEAQQAASKRVETGWRRWALFLIPAWAFAIVASFFVSSSPNRVRPDFYVACVTVLPVLVIAGFVELATLRRFRIAGAGVAWRVLAFVTPAAGGAIGCLHALAYGNSTTSTFQLAVASLANTFVTLVFLVLGSTLMTEPDL